MEDRKKNAFDLILEIKKRYETLPDFNDIVFVGHKESVLDGSVKVVIFGAGNLGIEYHSALKKNRVEPIYFVDNGNQIGKQISGIQVISVDELIKISKNIEIIILIASSNFNQEIYDQLILNGFSKKSIVCKTEPGNQISEFLNLYAMNSVWSYINNFHIDSGDGVLSILKRDEAKINKAYSLLQDQKSKDLFLHKLALILTNEHFELYKFFLENFSEPFLEFGSNKNFLTEEHYYFENDVISLKDSEVMIDVGGADGDTVETFIMACKKRKLEYKAIYVFEPDPKNYIKLVDNTSSLDNVKCYELGLWNQNMRIKFMSSNSAIHYESAAIDQNGDIYIEVVSLDSFLTDIDVTFIKMDPPGNVIPAALKGCQKIVIQSQPKLALGVYHSVMAIYEIPLLLNNLNPSYKIFIRHNARHTNETCMYGYV